jgi:hypothetical protein
MDWLKYNIGSLLLLLALVVLIVVALKSRSEDLQVPKVNVTPCKCQSCQDECYQRALNGQLPGCGGCNGTNYDQCNDSYRKCLLHGCGIASGSTCNC